MNTSAEVVLKWADGEYVFRLRIKEIDELQRVCNAGFGEIAQRVMSGVPYYRDVYDTIRLGLIGGGMPAVKALQMVQTYVEDRPFADPRDPCSPLKMAIAILQAKFFGLSDLKGDDEPKKATAATADTSTSRRSTVKARASAGHRRKSKK